MNPKITVTPEQLATDLQTAAKLLQALSGLIPQQVDATLVSALQAIAGNPLLLQLVSALLAKLPGN